MQGLKRLGSRFLQLLCTLRLQLPGLRLDALGQLLGLRLLLLPHRIQAARFLRVLGIQR